MVVANKPISFETSRAMFVMVEAVTVTIVEARKNVRVHANVQGIRDNNLTLPSVVMSGV